ncbi:ran GTPase-activating protein 1 [Strongylocentrotus purpuratus]|uniref:Ran-GTPase activating protein 1 C-terminal domain-containing protein n=1 Tax=Strongylocentrotus purpuratus TaxID=7668 RepID=A0A7M7NPS8_STRPU|nr:ran GTPase-activating protein 1 [Strongylocentrotus purpuratus]
MADVSGVTELLAKTSVDQLIEVSFSGKGLKLNSAEDAREVVAAVEACEGIQSLKLNGNTIGVEAAQALAKALESKPQFQRARWSDMFTGRLRSEIPPALMSLGAGIMTAGAHLVEIDLSDNAFGPDGVKAVRELLESSSCYTLREMRFNNNGLGIGGKLMAEALITCHEKSSKAGKPLALKVFIAGRNRLENPGATALAKAFKIIGTLEEIALPQNGINYEGITALAEAVEYSHNLKILNLNDNTFTARGAKPMAKAIKNLSKLEVINFGDCLVRSEGADAIANSLREGVPSLKELNLAFGEIKKEAAVRVAESMDTKPHLTLLDLNGNNIGEEGIELIQGIMDANNHADALGTLSDDEVSEDEEDDDDDEYEDVEDDEDVEEEKGGQESKDPHLQVKGTAISPRREETKYMIPVTAADFLAFPTANKLQALGNQRAEKILQELGDEVYEESAGIKAFVKISSVMESENNDVKNAVYQCTDAILKKLFSSEKCTPESVVNALLVHLGLIKGEDKLRPVGDPSGMLLTLGHAVKQQYYPKSTAPIFMTFLSRPNSKIDDCLSAKHGLMQAIYQL